MIQLPCFGRQGFFYTQSIETATDGPTDSYVKSIRPWAVSVAVNAELRTHYLSRLSSLVRYPASV